MSLKKWGAWLPWLSLAICALRLLLFVDAYALNVLTNDQWDIYPYAWGGASNWEIFRQQFGPHRMGFGQLLSIWLADQTALDLRVEAFASAGFLIAAAALALLWIRRWRGGLRWSDALVPLLLLNLAQGEIFVTHINFYMGSVQLFLLMLMLFALSLAQRTWRWIALAVLSPLLTHTGYGFFWLFVLLALALWEAWRERRALYLPFAVAIANAAFFFAGYRFEPAASCFVFPHPRPWEYVGFASFMLGRLAFEGAKGLPFLLGLVALAGWGAMAWRGWRRRDVIPLALLGFSLCYVGAASLGRVCLGVEAGSSSRFVPYLLPGFLGAYLLWREGTSRWTSRGLMVLLILGVLAEFHWRRRDFTRTYDVVKAGKEAWIACYLKTPDAVLCDGKTAFAIYPFQGRGLDAKLQHLRARRWSFFEEIR